MGQGVVLMREPSAVVWRAVGGKRIRLYLVNSKNNVYVAFFTFVGAKWAVNVLYSIQLGLSTLSHPIEFSITLDTAFQEFLEAITQAMRCKDIAYCSG